MTRRSQAPGPDHPSLEGWRALYAIAGEFRSLAPWRWATDTDLFGVQDPETGEIGWCSVFGAAAQVYGLMVYAGTAGLFIHQAMAAGQLAGEDAGYLQQGWLASFENRAALDREDAATITRLGLEFRGRHAWPSFRNYTAGFLPWRLAHGEARSLTVALEQALEVTRRLRDDAGAVVPDDAGRFLVRVAGAPGGPWEDRRLAPPPVVHEAPPPIDPLRVRRLRERLPRTSARWECDYWHSPAIIDDGEQRGYFASLFLAVEARSGMILDMALGKPPLRAGDLHHHFLGAIDKGRALPGKVLVKRGLVHAALEPLAAGLDLSLELVRTLPALDAARTGLAAHLKRR